MKQRYQKFRRENGIFYSIDTLTKKRQKPRNQRRRDRSTAGQRPQRSVQTAGHQSADRQSVSGGGGCGFCETQLA
jgi:hypothetical protein